MEISQAQEYESWIQLELAFQVKEQPLSFIKSLVNVSIQRLPHFSDEVVSAFHLTCFVSIDNIILGVRSRSRPLPTANYAVSRAQFMRFVDGEVTSCHLLYLLREATALGMTAE